MKIGQQHIRATHRPAWQDENIGVAGKRMQHTVFIARRFQQAERRGADRDDPATRRTRCIDARGGIVGQHASLGVNAVLGHVVMPHRQKRAGADMQCQPHLPYAPRLQRRHQCRRKMQPGGRCRDRTFVLGKQSLVIVLVPRGRALGPLDIRRQCQRAGPLQTLPKRRTLMVETQHDRAAILHRLDARGKIRRTLEHQRVAHTQTPGIAGQSVPGAVRKRPVQRNPDRSRPSPRRQLRRYHARIVDHQHIARPQQARQIPHDAVIQPVPHHQQPRSVARHGRELSDAFRWQEEIEIGSRKGHVR